MYFRLLLILAAACLIRPYADTPHAIAAYTIREILVEEIPNVHGKDVWRILGYARIGDCVREVVDKFSGRWRCERVDFLYFGRRN